MGVYLLVFSMTAILLVRYKVSPQWIVLGTILIVQGVRKIPMNTAKRIAVIGGGSWATAIVKILCNNANKVSWYFRSQEDVEYLNKYQHNPRYLSSVQFDVNKLNLSSNLLETLSQAEVIILAVPSTSSGGVAPSCLPTTQVVGTEIEGALSVKSASRIAIPVPM